MGMGREGEGEGEGEGSAKSPGTVMCLGGGCGGGKRAQLEFFLGSGHGDMPYRHL